MSFQTVNVMLGKSFLLNCQIFFVTLLLALPLGLIVSFGSISRWKPLVWPLCLITRPISQKFSGAVSRAYPEGSRRLDRCWA